MNPNKMILSLTGLTIAIFTGCNSQPQISSDVQAIDRVDHTWVVDRSHQTNQKSQPMTLGAGDALGRQIWAKVVAQAQQDGYETVLASLGTPAVQRPELAREFERRFAEVDSPAK